MPLSTFPGRDLAFSQLVLSTSLVRAPLGRAPLLHLVCHKGGQRETPPVSGGIMRLKLDIHCLDSDRIDAHSDEVARLIGHSLKALLKRRSLFSGLRFSFFF